MTPAALFRRIMKNQILETRYYNPRIVPVVARSVLQEVLKLVASSEEPGVFRPNPLLDGTDPLPHIVANSMRAVGAEDLIGEQLVLLVRLEFLVITDSGCIIIALSSRGGQRSSGTSDKPLLSPAERSAINRENGLKGGRGRTRPDAEHASQQGRLMLPLEGGHGPIPYGAAIKGEELAQRLRSEFHVAPATTAESEIVDQKPNLQSETAVLQSEFAIQSASGSLSVASPELCGEEEEDSTKRVLKEEVISGSSSSSARADAQTESENQKAKSEKQNPPAPSQGPIANISPAAIALADRYKGRWGCKKLDVARRCFEDRLQEGWKVDQIESAIDSDRTVEHPGLYKKVLPQLFGAPGRGPRLEPAARPDTRNYPPDLGGEWTDPIARIRARLQKALGEVEYRSWLGDGIRMTAFDDGELQIWCDTAFRAQHLRQNLEIVMLGVIKAIAPTVARLTFVSTALAKTG